MSPLPVWLMEDSQEWGRLAMLCTPFQSDFTICSQLPVALENAKSGPGEFLSRFNVTKDLLDWRNGVAAEHMLIT